MSDTSLPKSMFPLETIVPPIVTEILIALLFLSPLALRIVGDLCYVPFQHSFLFVASDLVTVQGIFLVFAFCFLLCFFMVTKVIYYHGFKDFLGFTPLVIILLLLLTIRILWSSFFDLEVFYGQVKNHLLLSFFGRTLIPICFFAITIPLAAQRTSFRLFWILLLAECMMGTIIIRITYSDPMISTEHYFRKIGLASALSIASVVFIGCTIWLWRCQKINVWGFILLNMIGTIGLHSGGRRTPLLVSALLVCAIIILSDIRKKKYFSIILPCIIVTHFVVLLTIGQLTINRLNTVIKDTTTIYSSIITDNKSINNKSNDDNKFINDKSTDSKSIDNESTDNKLIDNESIDNKFIDNKSTDNKSVDNESNDNKFIDDKSTNNKIINKISNKLKNDRFVSIIAGLHRIINSPLVGSYPLVNYKCDGYEAQGATIHCVPVDVFMCTGIFGGIIYIILVYQGFCATKYLFANVPELGILGILFLTFFFFSLQGSSIYDNVRFWYALVAVLANYRLGCILQNHPPNLPDK